MMFLTFGVSLIDSEHLLIVLLSFVEVFELLGDVEVVFIYLLLTLRKCISHWCFVLFSVDLECFFIDVEGILFDMVRRFFDFELIYCFPRFCYLLLTSLKIDCMFALKYSFFSLFVLASLCIWLLFRFLLRCYFLLSYIFFGLFLFYAVW